MSTHTPGPWCVSAESPKIIKRDYSAIGSTSGELIASAMGRDDSGFYATEAEAIANAHLIASAPALLAALKAHVRYEQAKSARKAYTPPSDRMKPGYDEGQAKMLSLLHDEWNARDEFIQLRDAALSQAQPEQKGGQDGNLD